MLDKIETNGNISIHLRKEPGSELAVNLLISAPDRGSGTRSHVGLLPGSTWLGFGIAQISIQRNTVRALHLSHPPFGWCN